MTGAGRERTTTRRAPQCSSSSRVRTARGRRLFRTPTPEPHDPLRLDRRRFRRRSRRCLVRVARAATPRHRRGDQPRRGRRQRAGAARVQRRHTAQSLGHVPADDRGAHLGADRPAACPAERGAALVDLGFPFSLYEQAPFPDPRRRSGDAHDRGRQPSRPAHRYRGGPARGPAGAGGQSGAGRNRDARRGARVHAGHLELSLSRLAADPRLGDRARPPCLPVALLGNSS
jgi:hypothetical protein